MYLSRIVLNNSRVAQNWSANPYRIHQRLLLAFDQEPRLLFRLEEEDERRQILVQSLCEPDWKRAFSELAVLQREVECKGFLPRLNAGGIYNFRLLANPTVKRNGSRLGLLREEDQQTWLARKLSDAGAVVLTACVRAARMQRSDKGPAKDSASQTHLAVLFEGVLRASDPQRLVDAVEGGIGAAKAYGFGLLSLKHCVME